MYAIGVSDTDFVCIESEMFVSDKVSWSDIERVVYFTDRCTVFSDLEEAVDALEAIRGRRCEIEFVDGSDDSIRSIGRYAGKRFDVDSLRVYELVCKLVEVDL